MEKTESKQPKKVIDLRPMLKRHSEGMQLIMEISSTVNKGIGMLKDIGVRENNRKKNIIAEIGSRIEKCANDTDRIELLATIQYEIQNSRTEAALKQDGYDRKLFDHILNEYVIPKLNSLRELLKIQQEIRSVVESAASKRPKQKGQSSKSEKNTFDLDASEMAKFIEVVIQHKLFNAKDRAILLPVLYDLPHIHTGKIIVNGAQKRFPTLLYHLIAEKKIRKNRKELTAWLINNFLWQKDKNSPPQAYKEASLSDVFNAGKSQKRLDPKDPDFIDVSLFLNKHS